ncbi:hypothetical protein ACIBEA_16680 [Streptomyces sp. NPDC051555]|uniref:hypothetical protein n=1 Tax=Streptomyces sp. NPDC051555 TaxID=3365657 RepID=UPI00379B1996
MPENTVTAPLAPMTPRAVMSAFNYLRAIEADDTQAATEFADAEPQMASLLVQVAQRIVIPVTTLANQEQKEARATTRSCSSNWGSASWRPCGPGL